MRCSRNKLLCSEATAGEHIIPHNSTATIFSIYIKTIFHPGQCYQKRSLLLRDFSVYAFPRLLLRDFLTVAPVSNFNDKARNVCEHRKCACSICQAVLCVVLLFVSVINFVSICAKNRRLCSSYMLGPNKHTGSEVYEFFTKPWLAKIKLAYERNFLAFIYSLPVLLHCPFCEQPCRG